MLNYDGEPFCTGVAGYQDIGAIAAQPNPKLYLQVSVGQLEMPVLAQIDTGAAWSVLSSELVREAGADPDDGAETVMSSRIGDYTGRLVRLPITLIAEEGDSLEVQATVFVSPEWPAQLSFLGYNGLLERLRFAVDPSTNQFFFGPLG